jgi:hypothetical protein
MKAQGHFTRLVALLATLTICLPLSADTFMGEYKGTYHPDPMTTMKASAKVIAEGDDVYYRIVIKAVPNEENQDAADVELHGSRDGSAVYIGEWAGGYHWRGQIQKGRLSISTDYGQHVELEKFVRKSPTEGLKPPQGAVVLLPFNEGTKPDMSAWTNTEWKALDTGAMQVNKGGNNSKQQFADIERFHLEFKLPLEPNNRGQGRANSGVYFAGTFEVQVLDSFGLTHTSGDCAGLYNRARARVNACLPPETWQTYDVEFRAPRLNTDGSVKENARITVRHNGTPVHDNVELAYSGDKWKGQRQATGPIHLQDHGHPIQYRNIWLVPGR